jgi:Ca2+-binding EF-hand superfamily protein
MLKRKHEDWQKLTKEEYHRYAKVYESFCITKDMLLPRLGVVCRMFLADDPKAELTKMMMELSDLLDPPEFETIEEYENHWREWTEKRTVILDQDLLAVSTFFANLQVSSKNQTS